MPFSHTHTPLRQVLACELWVLCTLQLRADSFSGALIARGRAASWVATSPACLSGSDAATPLPSHLQSNTCRLPLAPTGCLPQPTPRSQHGPPGLYGGGLFPPRELRGTSSTSEWFTVRKTVEKGAVTRFTLPGGTASLKGGRCGRTEWQGRARLWPTQEPSISAVATACVACWCGFLGA